MSLPHQHETATTDLTERFRRPLVLGAGPVGSAVVSVLVDRGYRPVVVTRSGTALPGAEVLRADLANRGAAQAALADASIVFSTAQPEYHRWAEEFPALQASIVSGCLAAGAPLMVVENLYAYGEHEGSLTETTPMDPESKKGQVRLELGRALEAAAADGLEMAVVRASDFVGPGVEGSAFGTRFFGPLAKGKPAQTVGNVHARHSVTFIPDLAEALVRVAEDNTAWGRAWHAPCAPAVTQNEMAAIAAASVGAEGKAKAAPRFLLRLVGIFVPPVRETIEMLYEFESDFIVDSSAFTDRFGFEATPLTKSLAVVMGAGPEGS